MKEELASATKSTHLTGSSKRGPSVSNIEKLKKYFENLEKQKNVHAKSGNKKTSNNSD